MKVEKIILGNYTSRTTGDVSEKITVKFDNGAELFLWCNLKEFEDKTAKECLDIMRKDASAYKSRIIINHNNQFGPQAQFSVVEETDSI